MYLHFNDYCSRYKVYIFKQVNRIIYSPLFQKPIWLTYQWRNNNSIPAKFHEKPPILRTSSLEVHSLDSNSLLLNLSVTWVKYDKHQLMWRLHKLTHTKKHMHQFTSKQPHRDVLWIFTQVTSELRSFYRSRRKRK